MSTDKHIYLYPGTIGLFPGSVYACLYCQPRSEANLLTDIWFDLITPGVKRVGRAKCYYWMRWSGFPFGKVASPIGIQMRTLFEFILPIQSGSKEVSSPIRPSVHPSIRSFAPLRLLFMPKFDQIKLGSDGNHHWVLFLSSDFRPTSLGGTCSYWTIIILPPHLLGINGLFIHKFRPNTLLLLLLLPSPLLAHQSHKRVPRSRVVSNLEQFSNVTLGWPNHYQAHNSTRDSVDLVMEDLLSKLFGHQDCPDTERV